MLSTLNLENNRVDQFMLHLPDPCHQIRASFDMGWQVRSSGGKYASPTGHVFLIGAVSKKIMDSVVFNKRCRVCTKHMACTGSIEDVRKHYCIKNYEGSSNSMEAAALTKMLIQMPDEKHMTICTVISNDDSNGRAKSCHKENGGELFNTVKEPTFLAAPVRHTERGFLHVQSIIWKSAVMNGLASRLKFCYGACVKQNGHLTAKELGVKVRNILSHICGDHSNCDSAWCYDKRAIEENKSYNAPADHRLQKEKHPPNEVLNQAIANAAPKGVC